MPRPFASILVVLVFTVWVFQGMSYHPHHGISVDLPKVLHPVAMRNALREDAMKVTILRDGKVYFGNEQNLSRQPGGARFRIG